MDEIGDIWKLAAGEKKHDQAAAWRSGGYVAASYHEAGEIPPDASYRETFDILAAGYPDESEKTVGQWATQLTDFLSDERKGEWVVIADGETVHLGVMGSPVTYIADGGRFPRRRPVDWKIEHPRSELPRYATQTAGCTFQANRAERNRAPVVALIQEHLAKEAGPALVGVPYRKADKDITTAPAVPSAPDPALTTAALRRHAKLQNRLAKEAKRRGLLPRSPQDGEPKYDLALTDPAGEHLTLCEVKSLPAAAEDFVQLRAGLAQLLHYADHFRDHEQLRRVLWVERAPADVDKWTRICAASGIVLGWPGIEDVVFG
ncbi:hypothetical protein [Streptomyces xanthophaeus]